MTNEEILKKAILKVINQDVESVFGYKLKTGNPNVTHENIVEWMAKEVFYSQHLYGVIFSHVFAEAFIKSLSKTHKEQIVDSMDLPKRFFDQDDIVTRCFLQMLVIQPEPLKYIGKFLEK